MLDSLSKIRAVPSPTKIADLRGEIAFVYQVFPGGFLCAPSQCTGRSRERKHQRVGAERHWLWWSIEGHIGMVSHRRPRLHLAIRNVRSVRRETRDRRRIQDISDTSRLLK